MRRAEKRDPVSVWADAHASIVMLGPLEMLLEVLRKVLQTLKPGNAGANCCCVNSDMALQDLEALDVTWKQQHVSAGPAG